MSNSIKSRLGAIRSRLTYANVLATVAIFAGLGGGAFAATKAAKNSVVSKSIKNGQVKTADVKDESLTGTDINEGTLKLPAAPSSATPSGPAGGDLAGTYPNPSIKDGAVTSAKVAANAVDSSKIADTSVTGADLAPNSVGAIQVVTESIDTGDLADFSVTGNKLSVGFQRVDETSASNSSTTKDITANCPAGKRAGGGGGAIGGLGAEIVGVTESFPTTDADGWTATGAEIVATASHWTVAAYALCADID